MSPAATLTGPDARSSFFYPTPSNLTSPTTGRFPLHKERPMNLLNRLKEPSTYAGLAAVAVALGISMEDFDMWVAAIAGLAGFVAMFVKDPGSES